jgi:DNA polymerase-1
VRAFDIPIFEMDGFEADDILGTLSKQAAAQGMDTVIVTGDGDMMQLVTDKTKVLYPKPRGSFGDADLYDAAAVLAKYEIGPEHIADYKALKGDPSDNIPGVKGIGEKTAVKLIQQFGGIEQIYAHLDEVTPPKLQALLRENTEIARQSKILTTIVTDAPGDTHHGGNPGQPFQPEQSRRAFPGAGIFQPAEQIAGNGRTRAGNNTRPRQPKLRRL